MNSKEELIQKIMYLVENYNESSIDYHDKIDFFQVSLLWYESGFDSGPTECYGWYAGRYTGTVGTKLREPMKPKEYIPEEDSGEITAEGMFEIRQNCPQHSPSEDVESL